MTHVSKQKLEDSVDKELDEILRSTFTNLPNSEVLALLTAVFTKTELKMVKKRLGYFYLRDKGFFQDELANILKTTRQTIIRFSLQNKVITTEHKKVLFNRIKQSSLKSKLIDVIKALNEIDISRSNTRRKISPF
ncbi:MAG TPA: hypothetical protein VI819_00230 [Patescibacteria group bacterium]|nr:hypothetical protein [Patescibacteria group bacterium]